MCEPSRLLGFRVRAAVPAALVLGLLMTVAARGATIVGHWKFDGDFSDSIGSNDAAAPTPGTGTNDVFVGTANGISGGAADFDGDQDAVTLPNAATSLITDNTYSLSFWEWSPAGSNVGYFAASGHTGGWEAFFFRRTTAPGYDGGHGPDSGRVIVGAGTVSREEWHQVVLTVDSSEVARLYVDGVRRGNDEAAPNQVFSNLGSSLWLGNRLDFARDFDGLIDDVQIYDAPLDPGQIKVMSYAPGVAADGGAAYREIFPNDTGPGATLASEGWKTHYGSGATATAGPVIQQNNAPTAYGADRAPVNSDPQDTGATAGYLNNYGGPTTSDGYLYWTEELASVLAPAVFLEPDGVDLISFDSRMNSASYVSRVALKIDDAWFVSADFDNPTGTSAFTHTAGSGAWQTNVLDFDTAEWTTLTFDPGNTLLKGTTEFSLPDGRITAFGIYQDTHVSTTNARFDNFTIVGTLSVPEPATLALLGLGVLGLLPAARRRRRN